MAFDELRYPPTGDVELWVRYGPAGPAAEVNNWRGRDLELHEHVAPEAGADCRACGFPWWPDAPVVA